MFLSERKKMLVVTELVKKTAFSRMCTTPLPTVHVFVATTTYQYCEGRGLGPQVNKFEQVSSDDFQMSVARGQVPCLVFKASPNASWVMVTWGRGRSHVSGIWRGNVGTHVPDAS